jgi:alpha-beta hydrolase superfamily lysophospholipase
MMTQSAFIAIAILISLALLFYCIRLILFLSVQKSSLKTKPNGKETPADLGLEYADFKIRSGSRELQAWWVKASPTNDIKKAVLIFHGNNESISEWIPVQQLLWQHGISSIVFDYSGFGNSSGKATIQTLREDVIAAWNFFHEKVDNNVDKYLLGLSLGTGFLLEASSSLTGKIRGIILIAVYSSARDYVLLKKMLPSSLAFLFPNVYNNVQRIQSVQIPLLIVHSRSDEVFSSAMAQQVYTAANEPKRLVLLDGLKHNDTLEGKAADYFAPVIEFLKGN